MSWLVEHGPAPAMIVAVIALLVAMGGSAYAVSNLPPNSVGTKQLKDGAVTSAKLRNGAVTAKKVKMGSLLPSNFKAGQLPQGPKGATGPAGPPGPSGATGPQGSAGATNVVVRTQSLAATPANRGLSTTYTARPASGRLGAGPPSRTGPDPNDDLMWSKPVTAGGVATNGSTPTGWVSIIKNNSASARASTGYVVCAQPLDR